MQESKEEATKVVKNGRNLPRVSISLKQLNVLQYMLKKKEEEKD